MHQAHSSSDCSGYLGDLGLAQVTEVAANVYCGPMKKQQIRFDHGCRQRSSGNLIRALRATRPRPYIAGMNDDRFVLKMSLADHNHVSPAPASDDFVRAMLEIIKRERINVVMPTDENIVKALSEQRGQFPIELLLPRQDTIDLCQDKHALNLFLRRRAIPAPLTYNVNSLKDLDGIFARFSRAGVLWCRVRRGARSVAATPVSTVEQARAWITQWRDLQGIKVSDFTLGEYLPGRHYVIPSVWRDGKLLRAQSIEVLGYFAAGNNPSGIFSLSCLARRRAGEASNGAQDGASDRGISLRVFVVELKKRQMPSLPLPRSTRGVSRRASRLCSQLVRITWSRSSHVLQLAKRSRWRVHMVLRWSIIWCGISTPFQACFLLPSYWKAFRLIDGPPVYRAP